MRSTTLRSMLIFSALVAVIVCPPAWGYGDGSGRAGDPVPVTSYVGTVWGVALGVEADGRVHVLWTGQRPTDTEFTAFYASSTDGGVTWGPLQILDTGNAFDPQIAVDDSHQIVHLVYRSNFNGIMHRTVVDGVVSEPDVVDTSVGDTTVVWPKVAVDTESGWLHALWIRNDWGSGTAVPMSVVASWDGLDWSTPVSPLRDGDGSWSAIAAGTDGSVTIAAVQNELPKIAYSADGISFGAAAFLATSYPGIERDSWVIVEWAPFDNTYHVVTTHDIQPGSSELYHFVRNPLTGAWSSPQSLTVGSTDGWSVRPGLASVSAVPFLHISWMEEDVSGRWLQARSSAGDTLGEIHNISDDIFNLGVDINFNNRHQYFLAADGVPHLVLGASPYLDIGVFYQRLDPPPAPPQIFVDGFESGGTSAWAVATH